MGFLSPALLGGAGLIVIPIALHLIMRRKPIRQTFPALRFVKQRRDANRQRLQLRQWLLLALRCLLIALLALALARPTFRGSGLEGKAGAPLALAVVIDNAPQMLYRHGNKTRIDVATESAARWVSRLMPPSEIAIVDRGRGAARLTPDMATAAARLRSIGVTMRPKPLAAVIEDAISAVAQRTDFRQEIFVFSDFSRASWNAETIAAIEAALADAAIQLTLVDVGIEPTHNIALGDLELLATTLHPGEPLTITSQIERSFDGAPLVVELLLGNSDETVGDASRLSKRGERLIETKPDEPVTVSFELSDLPLGTHQGVLRLPAVDPLAIDNQRYFTVTVQPPAHLLLLAATPADALFVKEALNPSLLGDQPAPYRTTIQRFAEFQTAKLESFDAVWLLDPPPQSAETWNELHAFAQQGGGVGIFLGHNAQPFQRFNEEAPQRVLPGPLLRRSREETTFRPQRFDHPALAALRDYAEGIRWQAFPVLQSWQLETLAGDGHVIASFANGAPALIERQVGRGVILTLTTPISDPLNPVGRQPWNLLPTGAQPWPFVVLCDQWASYLSQRNATATNYVAGDTARLTLDKDHKLQNYVLHPPDGQALRRSNVASEREIVISTTQTPGNYRITAGGQAQRMELGFSTNLPANLSDLSRVDVDALLADLPSEQVQLATDLEVAEQLVDGGDGGSELTGWAMTLLALVWAGEHWLANRFYRETT